MFYALAKEGSTINESLKRVIALAPCFIMRQHLMASWMYDWYDETIAKFQDHGVHALRGPNWEQDKDKICAQFPLVCPYFKFISSGEATSVKSLQHWMQNAIVDEWREFSEDWVTEDEEYGQNKGQMIDPSKIQGVPMSFFVASMDEICSYSDAESHIAAINTEGNIEKTWIRTGWSGHGYFADTSDDWLMSRIWDELEK